MNLPLSCLHGSSGRHGRDEPGYEIYLNRSGINSIDLPRGKITAECGDRLVLKFMNRGAPIHITISSSNASMYTDFFHENLYVVDESVLTIPIRKDSDDGSFDLEIIAGYGVVKTTTHSYVVHPSAPETDRAGRDAPSAGCPWPPPSPYDHDGNCPDPVYARGST